MAQNILNQPSSWADVVKDASGNYSLGNSPPTEWQAGDSPQAFEFPDSELASAAGSASAIELLYTGNLTTGDYMEFDALNNSSTSGGGTATIVTITIYASYNLNAGVLSYGTVLATFQLSPGDTIHFKSAALGTSNPAIVFNVQAVGGA